MRVRRMPMAGRPMAGYGSGPIIVTDLSGRVHKAFPRAFGAFRGGQTNLVSSPQGAFVVPVEQVAFAPADDGGGAPWTGWPFQSSASYAGNLGDPGQTYADITTGVSQGMGTQPSFPGIPKGTLQTLQTLLAAAEADQVGGDTGTPLILAAQDAVNQLSWDVANCVSYQINDTGGITGSGICAGAFCRSTTRGNNYSNWLHTLASDVNAAIASLQQASALELSQQTGQQTTQQSATGATYITATGSIPPPAAGVLASAIPSVQTGVAAESGTTTILGMDPTTLLLLAGGAAALFFLFHKKKPAQAAA